MKQKTQYFTLQFILLQHNSYSNSLQHQNLRDYINSSWYMKEIENEITVHQLMEEGLQFLRSVRRLLQMFGRSEKRIRVLAEWLYIWKEDIGVIWRIERG